MQGKQAQPQPKQQPQPLQQGKTATAAPAAAPGSCLVTLTFSSSASSETAAARLKQKQLYVDRALLWHASPVLRGLIEDTGYRTATLTVMGDDPADWEAALKILHHDGLPVTWDNVGYLLRLADKYDIAAVRTACAVFLGSKVSSEEVGLTHPLDSARNLLHAASLVEWYLLGPGTSGDSGSSSGQADLQPYTAVMPAVLETALQPLRRQPLTAAARRQQNMYGYSSGYSTGNGADAKPQQGSARDVISTLKSLQAHPQYDDIVARGVQGRVMAALLACLEQVFKEYGLAC
ncbi:hypothetical protein HXX76_003015 [Chlamydomonas incerta]|uniref:BTB domain-containing protein n=1 Tax=Chlamydomonas incerta TaxID=51695 RepID=A0A835TLR6_CHLIN|nr:hypothetical protein HXX76_003015 [Chlamydomonas incerta]|eukprot:KAG2442939.1 hypothetical protein HXX76_003015 [Chlamydomonas incerta]